MGMSSASAMGKHLGLRSLFISLNMMGVWKGNTIVLGEENLWCHGYSTVTEEKARYKYSIREL